MCVVEGLRGIWLFANCWILRNYTPITSLKMSNKLQLLFCTMIVGTYIIVLSSFLISCQFHKVRLWSILWDHKTNYNFYVSKMNNVRVGQDGINCGMVDSLINARQIHIFFKIPNPRQCSYLRFVRFVNWTLNGKLFLFWFL